MEAGRLNAGELLVRKGDPADWLYVLLSGAAVLKQQAMGIVEWFEPLLVPYVHYVPVSSTLHNLSDAVRWVRAHQAQARAIARRRAPSRDVA